MLPSPVGVFSPASSGGGIYTFQLFFQSAGLAPYLRVGDIVTDLSSNQYQVTTWATSPSDFGSGTVVTTTFITSDVLPTASVGFDSLVETSGQQDVRPVVQTPGSIFNITLFSGQNAEYTLEASWTTVSEGNKAVVGDRIVDSLGKEFEITFLDTGQFSDPFRMKEVENEGIAPGVGIAALYRHTPNLELFQGSPLNDDARTIIRNRDNTLLDNLSSGSSNGDWTVVTHEVTGGELTAKQFTLASAPLVPSEVVVSVMNGPSELEFSFDYSITGSTFGWSGLSLDGLLETGDKIHLRYFA